MKGLGELVYLSSRCVCIDWSADSEEREERGAPAEVEPCSRCDAHSPPDAAVAIVRSTQRRARPVPRPAAETNQKTNPPFACGARVAAATRSYSSFSRPVRTEARARVLAKTQNSKAAFLLFARSQNKRLPAPPAAANAPWDHHSRRSTCVPEESKRRGWRLRREKRREGGGGGRSSRLCVRARALSLCSLDLFSVSPQPTARHTRRSLGLDDGPASQHRRREPGCRGRRCPRATAHRQSSSRRTTAAAQGRRRRQAAAARPCL